MGVSVDEARRIAARYAPAFIRIRYKRKKNGKLVLKPAHACLQLEEMLVPKPETLEALAYFLHECAHFHLRHFDPEEARTPKLEALYTGGATKTVAEQEYEAEAWTLATLRREGIAVPQHVIEDMRDYVRQCIAESEGKIPRRVRRFVR
jgi:hypothetical protein